MSSDQAMQTAQSQNKYWPWMLARIFLAAVFIFAGFLKLSGPVENFRGMIASYGVVPYAWIGVIAHTMPWLEFIFGITLFVGYLPRIASAVLGVLSFSFICLIAFAQVRGTLPANCGCFGDGFHMSPYQMSLLDALNVLLSVKLFQIRSHRWCLAA